MELYLYCSDTDMMQMIDNLSTDSIGTMAAAGLVTQKFRESAAMVLT